MRLGAFASTWKDWHTLLGSSLQGAPVHRIQRIPSKHRLSSTLGLPPFGLGLYGGRWPLTFSYCSSVNFRHLMPPALTRWGFETRSRSIARLDRQYPDDFRLLPIRGHAEDHTLMLDPDGL
ncbi:MAG: hypothetical protein QXT77_07465 [Candidatus Methanomethylicaceae archaeon]